MNTLFKLAPCAALALAIAGPAAAETTLRFSHSYTDGDTRDRWADYIAEAVAERTEGEVTIEVYPNQQLFKAKAQADTVARDRLDLASYPLPWLSGRAPITEIGALPGLVTSPLDGVDWRNRPIWPMLQEAVSGAGVELLGSGWAMATIGTADTPVIAPEDLAGQKVRGLGKASELMMAELGATITSVPGSEIYQSMQTGVLTGDMTIYASFEGYSLDEVTNHLLVGPGFIGAMHSIIGSPGLEAKLGAEDYATLIEVIAESESWFAEQSIEDNDRIAREFAEAGVEIHELTPEQVAVWHKASRDHAWTYFREEVDGGAEALEAAGAHE
ncbi:MAG: hypothetical protein CML68_13995 [Rhodobacteraceae bacterium]|nr:hypothetical protein [Paracoccaceae bacterium]